MAGIIPNLTRLRNMYVPTENEGPRSIVAVLPLATQNPVSFDFIAAAMDGDLSFIQSVWADNYDNPSDLIITVQDTPHRIIIPANCQGTFPVFANGLPHMIASSAGGIDITVMFLNIPMPYFIVAKGIGLINASLATAGIQRGSWVDRSGFIAVANTSQQLMPANANRKRMFVENPSAEIESLWIVPGAGPAVQARPSIELVPGGTYNEDGTVSTDAWQVIAQTINHSYIAKEM